ncbi:MAG: SGNH/GDSL hydrolase family protein [Lachnospiraceae bacterium]
MKLGKDVMTHIAIIAVILIILIVSVVKLIKWNQGSPDAGTTITDETFDTEPEDYITAVDNAALEGRPDDGITSIVFLGDDVLSNYQGADGIPQQVAYLMASNPETAKTQVYNIGFPGMYQSTASVYWDEAHSEDAFSLYWLTKSITLQDYTLLHNTVDTVSAGNPQFAQTLQTLEGIDFDKVDVITLMYGVNDYLNGRLVTDIADDSNIASYSGALNASIKLLKEAFPHIRIIVMSPTYCEVTQDGKTTGCDVTDTGHGTLADYMVAAKTIAVDTNVTYLDNFYGVDINANTAEQYLEDTVHPNAEGRKLIAQRLAKLLTKERQN